MKKKIFAALTALIMVTFAGTTLFADARAALAAKKKVWMEEASKKLTGREWTVYVYVTTAGKKGALETDVMKFTNLTVTSKNLSGLGFGTSNYALRVDDNGAATWETMQRNADGDVAFLAGEIRGDVMNGGETIQYAKGDQADFGFSTIAPKVVPTVGAPPSAGAKPAVKEAETKKTTPAPEAAKTEAKKGWF